MVLARIKVYLVCLSSLRMGLESAREILALDVLTETLHGSTAGDRSGVVNGFGRGRNSPSPSSIFYPYPNPKWGVIRRQGMKTNI